MSRSTRNTIYGANYWFCFPLGTLEQPSESGGLDHRHHLFACFEFEFPHRFGNDLRDQGLRAKPKL